MLKTLTTEYVHIAKNSLGGRRRNQYDYLWALMDRALDMKNKD